MLIFIHIQKTGGTSILTQLKENDNEQCLLDYDDHPTSEEYEFVQRRRENKSKINAYLLSESYNIIFGHFKADKYDALKDNSLLVTMLREPINRTISHYYFWKYCISENVVSDEFFRAHPEIKSLKENELDLVSFANLDKNKNFYKNYFCNKTVDDFAFIGITEYYRESIYQINKQFGMKLNIRHDNAVKRPDFDEQMILPELQKANLGNSYFYKKALEKFLSNK